MKRRALFRLIPAAIAVVVLPKSLVTDCPKGFAAWLPEGDRGPFFGLERGGDALAARTPEGVYPDDRCDVKLTYERFDAALKQLYPRSAVQSIVSYRPVVFRSDLLSSTIFQEEP